MYAILRGAPAALTGRRTGVPAELERVMTRTLSKQAEGRYQRTAELVAELRTIRRALESGAATALAGEKAARSEVRS
jgi:hypothetical protein